MLCIMRVRVVASVFALLLTACGEEEPVTDFDRLASHVASNKVGRDTDYWIEMRNMAGEWERTGLIFGYVDDYAECLNAVAGLKKVNYAREYRCRPAN
jgi:hypothetical protein